MKQNNIGNLTELKVGDKIFSNGNVQDGFYAAVSQLKLKISDSYESSRSQMDYYEDYRHILELCKSTEKVPPIPENVAFDILATM